MPQPDPLPAWAKVLIVVFVTAAVVALAVVAAPSDIDDWLG